MGQRGFFVRDHSSILVASLIHAGSFSMNVFVTGAAGFIGGSIATGLIRAGHKVT
ncbi:epimerase, partial [Bacillus sp. AFS076308]